jgi:hypothetical protein
MIHNMLLCSSDRDRHDTDDVSENEILFLYYYHINQPFLRRQLISILTDRQKYS